MRQVIGRHGGLVGAGALVVALVVVAVWWARTIQQGVELARLSGVDGRVVVVDAERARQIAEQFTGGKRVLRGPRMIETPSGVIWEVETESGVLLIDGITGVVLTQDIPVTAVATLQPAEAQRIAEGDRQGLRLIGQPELVLYQGTLAYRVVFDRGIVYVAVQTGRILLDAIGGDNSGRVMGSPTEQMREGKGSDQEQEDDEEDEDDEEEEDNEEENKEGRDKEDLENERKSP